MEPVTVLGLIFSCVLVCERMFKYYIKHIKKSSCCNSQVEFN